MDSLTYLGAFDDVVHRYPWQTPVNEAYLRTMIVRHVLFGGRLLLNDGYLVQHPVLQQALQERFESPLFGLIDDGFVAVLSTQKDIIASLEARAKSGVASIKALFNSALWNDIEPTLASVNRSLQKQDQILLWPRKDIGSGFAAALRRARGPASAPRSPSDLGLRCTPKRILARVFARFDEAAQTSNEALRTRWEAIVREESAHAFANRLAIQRELMGLANEAYHFNFAACLSAERPEIIGVETRCSEAFDELLDTPEIDYERLQGFAPLRAPTHPAMSNSAKLRDFVREGFESHTRKRIYLDAQSAYLSGRIDGKHYEEVSADYAAYIAQYFGARYVSRKQALGVSIALFAGTTAAGFVATPASGAVLGAVAFVADQFIAPHILRKLAVRQIESQTHGATLGGDRIQQRRAIASVMIDRQKAADLASALPDRS